MKIYYYGDISTIKHINDFFHQKLESIQYKAALPIIGAMRGTFREQLYHALGFESLKSRR